MADYTNLSQLKLGKKVIETVLGQTVLFARLAADAKPFGPTTRYTRAVRVSQNNNITPWTGLDTLAHGITNTTITLAYDRKKVATSVEVADDEISANMEDPERVVDMLQYKIEEAALDLASYLGTEIYTSNGTDTKKMLGLAALVDDGSVVPLIGGVDRTVYTTLKSTVTPSGGTLTLAMLDTFISTISEGADRPTVMIAGTTVFNLIKKLIAPLSHTTPAYVTGNLKGGLSIGGGSVGAILYSGVEIIEDKKCPAQTIYGLNEKWIEMRTCTLIGTTPISYSAQMEDGVDMFMDSPKGLGFVVTPKRLPYSQMGSVSYIHYLGELMTFQPKRHGKITGVTTA